MASTLLREHIALRKLRWVAPLTLDEDTLGLSDVDRMMNHPA